MSPVRSYRDLIVWQLAMQLAKHVYQATEMMPKSEIYGLTSQLRRSAVSIPSNSQESVTSLLASADDLGRRLRGLQKSMRAKVE
jgi:23S rRNA-intervening sequence protein